MAYLTCPMCERRVNRRLDRLRGAKYRHVEAYECGGCHYCWVERYDVQEG